MPTGSSAPLDPHPGDSKAKLNLLLRHEQELLARILHHAEDLSTISKELLPLVQTAITRAVGELLLLRSAEETAAEIVEILKAGPHPPKSRPQRDTGPHPPVPPKPPGPGEADPLDGPHPPKPPTPGQTPLKGAGPHPPSPPKPPGPGKVLPAKKPQPSPPGTGPRPPVGPHPPGATPRKASAEVVDSPRELQANYVTAEEFLMPSELRELMRFALARQANFEISEVVSPGVIGRGSIDHEYRRSRVLMHLEEYEERLLKRIRGMLPLVFRKLRMPAFEPSRAELQITASNDGDFFRDHSDNGHPEIASRALTFVYFFHQEPKPFQGGELRLYDSRFGSDYWVRNGGGSRVIVPEQNQMIFFPSELVHEITPVVCPSRSFAHSRFTVNGWLHRS